VEAIWVPVWRPKEGKRGSVLELCGTRPNLEMAEYVHSFLTETGERLWRAYRQERRLPGDRERRQFLAGVMAGFRERLQRERRRHEAEGLVWTGDGDLSRYLRRRHPYVRFTHHAGSGRSEAHRDGRAEGEKVILHRPVAAGPGGARRLLSG
jgi:hypothetical protein